MRDHTLNRAIVATLGAAALLLASDSNAQSIREFPTTPALSPAATVSQTVGVTSMSVSYSSPAAREREVWGDLVPYGELWRAGANAPTRITFDRAVTIGGTTLDAGTYTVMILPTAVSWTFVFNTDSAGRGVYTHNAAEDVARVQVTPVAAPFRERLVYTFDDTTDDSTQLTLDWAGMKGSVAIGTDTATFVQANIDEALGSLWRPQFTAARYLLDTGGDLALAAELMRGSVAIEANWWNHWFMALIEHERGENASARQYAERTLELGAGDATFESFFKADAEAALAEWPRR